MSQSNHYDMALRSAQGNKAMDKLHREGMAPLLTLLDKKFRANPNPTNNIQKLAYDCRQRVGNIIGKYTWAEVSSAISECSIGKEQLEQSIPDQQLKMELNNAYNILNEKTKEYYRDMTIAFEEAAKEGQFIEKNERQNKAYYPNT